MAVLAFVHTRTAVNLQLLQRYDLSAFKETASGSIVAMIAAWTVWFCTATAAVNGGVAAGFIELIKQR